MTITPILEGGNTTVVQYVRRVPKNGERVKNDDTQIYMQIYTSYNGHLRLMSKDMLQDG